MKKRLFALALTIATLLGITCVSTANDDCFVFDYTLAFRNYTTLSSEYNPVESCMHYTIGPGVYGGNDVMLMFTAESFDMFQYPYVRLDYRTNSESDIIDTTIITSAGENWFIDHPANTPSEKWESIVFDVREINGNSKVLNPKSELGITLRFKVCSNAPTITKDTYFDVKTLAFFQSEKAARAFDPDKYYKKNSPEIDFDSIQIKDGTEKLAELDLCCDELINEIKSTPTTVNVTGQKYYVSMSGNDNNDGKTPETAWQSLNMASDFTYMPGDGVFFKRGEYFRAEKSFVLQSGVTYSAYGKGDKPVFVGSLPGSSAALWSKTDVENVYRFATFDSDIGCIVFDGGRAWGVKVTNDGGTSVYSGNVNNGLESYVSGGKEYTGYASLENNLEFTTVDGVLYLYCKDGNPAEVFDSIELSPSLNGVTGKDISDVVFDNIKLYGYGEHGISVENVKNFTVQNCVFGWIGGSLNRLGNAVQNWGNSENFTIDHCYSYQIYDCCYTTQYSQNGGKDILNKSFTISNTVSEYANSGPEIWNHVTGSDETAKNTVISYDNIQLYNNFARRMGYGWSHQRPSKDGNFYYGAYEDHKINFNNFKFYDNNFMLCYYVGILGQFVGKNTTYFNANTYVIGEDKLFAKCAVNPDSGYGAIANLKYDINTVAWLRSYGVEADGDFYSVPKDFAVPAFDYKSQNDIYNALPYSDVSEHWANDYIRYVVDRGIFEGISPIEFAPNANMTRAMLFTALARIANAELEDGESWYQSAVDYAISANLTSSANARPDELVTRSELALIIERFIEGMYAKTSAKDTCFADEDEIVDITDSAVGETKAAIEKLVGAQIIKGYDDNTFKPQALSTRAEVAAMIYRMECFLNEAEFDIGTACENGAIVKLDSDKLAQILTVYGKSATVLPYNDNGTACVRIDPVIANGTVRVDLAQNKTDVDFYNMPYMVVNYKLTNGEKRLDVGLVGSFGEQWTRDALRRANTDGKWVKSVTCYDDETASTIATLPNTSDASYVYTFKPWGNNNEIPEGSYFEIESIYFTLSKELAERIG